MGSRGQGGFLEEAEMEWDLEEREGARRRSGSGIGCRQVRLSFPYPGETGQDVLH